MICCSKAITCIITYKATIVKQAKGIGEKQATSCELRAASKRQVRNIKLTARSS